jgi:hypothetical protein
VELNILTTETVMVKKRLSLGFSGTGLDDLTVQSYDDDDEDDDDDDDYQFACPIVQSTELVLE